MQKKKAPDRSYLQAALSSALSLASMLLLAQYQGCAAAPYATGHEKIPRYLLLIRPFMIGSSDC